MKQVEELLSIVPTRILSLLSGKLLGDANLTIQNGRQPRFRFQHCIVDGEWCQYCYLNLKDYMPLSLPKYKFTSDSRLRKGFSESVYVQSRTSPLFNSLKELWYVERTKVIPFQLLKHLITPELLAWWYQDDGHLLMNNGVPRKIILSTDNFSRKENEKLSILLREKFSLNFSIDNQNRLCLYNQPQIFYFLNLVTPHVHSSMKRKLLVPNTGTCEIPLSKRTTVKLASDILIKNPTQDITTLINNIDENEFIKRWFGRDFLLRNNSIRMIETKSYQIILKQSHLNKLYKIKESTGLSIGCILTLESYIKKIKGGLSQVTNSFP